MRKANSLLPLWLALLSLVLVVPKLAGALGPITSGGSGLDQAVRGVSAGGIVPISSTGNTGNMLQFEAGGHVLGFQANKVFLAGLDHALSVEFLGTHGVMPTPVATGPDAGNTGKAPPLSTVVYRNLWEGIDLTYGSTEWGIAESTYHVSPGADPSKIQIRYNVPVELQGDGSLRVRFASGYVTESPPVAWQVIEGKRVPVRAEFKVAGNEVGFVLGPYDRSQPLIIDPTLEWHTFYGSYITDFACGIAVDGSGNIYVTGESQASWGSPRNAFSGLSALFVLKLDSSGAYQWHTFYGSDKGIGAYDIALEGSDNIYVTGSSWTSWGSPLHAHSGDPSGDPLFSDIFVLKLDSSGTYQWHTFYGSGTGDGGRGIALDGNGNVYVTGFSNATWGSPLHAHSGDEDTFVLKLDNSGAYQWHTFYGSGATSGIALDGSGNIYVTGWSNTTWGAPLHAHSGDPSGDPLFSDIFLLKLDSSGTYQWHTFYGSRTQDISADIAVDGNGNVYVTGQSFETWGSPLHAHSGEGLSNDIFVLKLDSTGTYQWHTFYGSSNNSGESDGEDVAYDVSVEGSGEIHVAGVSARTWGSPLYPHSGYYDVIILTLDTNGAYQWNSFHGSSGYDEALGITVDGSGHVYVSGFSSATWGSPLNPYSGGNDLFVLSLSNEAVETGSLLVTISPQSAIDAGAQWRVDGDAWRNSGTTLSAIPTGGHSLEFKDIFGWDKPVNQVVSIAENQTVMASGIYVRQMGSLSVTIGPQSAVVAGAQWKVDGGHWQNSGAIVSGLAVGQHVVEFKDLPGWTRPANRMVSILGDQTASVGYVLIPSTGLVDCNGDTRGDIIWRHTGGALSFWQMEGLTVNRVENIPPIDPSWQVAALGDFNGDGMTDILWRHTGGMLYTWLMNGASPICFRSPGTRDASYSVVGAADFGGEQKWAMYADGKADILWRPMNGLYDSRGFFFGQADLSWQVEALADFDGDRRADILWRHSSGVTYLWLMNGVEDSPGTVDLGWTIASAADFTGDGKADILWRHTSGLTAIWQMDGLQFIDVGIPGGVDPSWSIACANDFNGDGKADILWRHSSGATYLWLMNGLSKSAEGSLGFVDPSWEIVNK